MPRAIAPEVTITTRSPPCSSSPTCAQTESSTSARSSPSSAATIEEPSLTTRVMAGKCRRPGLTRGDSRRMAEFRTVRVAAVQATPVILDAEARREGGRADRRGRRRRRRAGRPARDVRPALPVAGLGQGRRPPFDGFDELWERLWANSVDVPGPLTDELVGGLRRARASHCAIGVNEREAERPGSLYNTLLLIGPEGWSGSTAS